MERNQELDISRLTSADLQRIYARGRAMQAVETRQTMRRAVEMFRRWWR